MADTNHNDYGNVSVGKPKVGGAVFVAPYGTALPTDATSALNAAFQCLGAISESGVSRTHDMDVSEFYDWEGNLAESSKRKYHEQQKFECIETNGSVLKTAWGDTSVTDSAAATSWIRKSFNDAKLSIVVETVLKDGRISRDVTACADLVGIGDHVKKPDGLIAYPFTFNCLFDAAAGYCSKEYVTKKQSA